MRGGRATGKNSVPTAGGSDCETASGPSPALFGLVQWAKGDAALDIAGGRALSWADQSGHAQDWVQTVAAERPYDLGDSADGVPGISFGAAGDANKWMRTAANFVDRDGVDMTTASARTIYALIRPRFDVDWGVTGGQLWNHGTLNAFQALFDLESTFTPDGAYAFARAWRGTVNANEFGPITGGAGGPYNGALTLLEWSSSGSPDLSFRINNVPTAVAPAAMGGATGPATFASLSVFGTISFLGTVFEQMVYDYKQGTRPADHAQTIDYMIARYPTAPIVP